MAPRENDTSSFASGVCLSKATSYLFINACSKALGVCFFFTAVYRALFVSTNAFACLTSTSVTYLVIASGLRLFSYSVIKALSPLVNSEFDFSSKLTYFFSFSTIAFATTGRPSASFATPTSPTPLLVYCVFCFLEASLTSDFVKDSPEVAGAVVLDAASLASASASV